MIDLSSNITKIYTLDSRTPVSNLRRLLLVIQMTYGIPSFIMMVFFMVSLRKYPNSFYRLVQMGLLVNILCYLNTWIVLRTPPYSIGVQLSIKMEQLIPGLLTICHESIFFWLHLQAMSAISFSVHRITSVIFYQGYDRFWSRWYLLIFLFLATTSSLPELLLDGRSNYFYFQNGILTQTTIMPRVLLNMIITGVAAVIYFLLLFFVGSLAAYLIYKKVRDFNVGDREIGKKLTKIAITYCFIFSGILFWMLVALVASREVKVDLDGLLSFGEEFKAFSSDMMTLALPYILLIFDANVRRDVFRQSVPIAVNPIANSVTN